MVTVEVAFVVDRLLEDTIVGHVRRLPVQTHGHHEVGHRHTDMTQEMDSLHQEEIMGALSITTAVVPPLHRMLNGHAIRVRMDLLQGHPHLQKENDFLVRIAGTIGLEGDHFSIFIRCTNVFLILQDTNGI